MALPRPGDVIAGCRLEGTIGHGGMGVVFRATELSLERPVAIKLIAADRAENESARRRFEREARMMAAIDHPNVLPIYAAGEQDGALYLTMRYVDGLDLQRRLADAGRLDPIEAARIIDAVARALDAAHARGLVHRDIKPANVLLAGDHVYLTDFGITRLAAAPSQATETGEWVGTLDFTSPEHLRGHPTDARSDVYSLGCLFYTCLIGVPPFERSSTAATVAAHLQERPPALGAARSGLPRGLDQVIGRALAKNPAHRYRSAGALGAAAVAAAAGRATSWRAPRTAASAAPAVADAAPAGAPPIPAGDAAEPAPTRRISADGASTRPSPAHHVDEARHMDEERRPGDAASTRPVRGAGAATAPLVRGDAPTLVLTQGERELARRDWRPSRGSRHTRIALAGLGTGLVVVIGALSLIGRSPAPPRPARPFTPAQVLALARAFARAYGHRDIGQLAVLLAPGVQRVTPTVREDGAAAVLADYRRQFHTRPLPRGDTLSGVVASGGWTGRIAASYRVSLVGAPALLGSVTLAVGHVGARPRIELIATQETGPPSPVSRPHP